MLKFERVTAVKIIQRGKTAHAIPLPSLIMKEFGISLGDEVVYNRNGNTLVLAFPKHLRGVASQDDEIFETK